MIPSQFTSFHTQLARIGAPGYVVGSLSSQSAEHGAPSPSLSFAQQSEPSQSWSMPSHMTSFALGEMVGSLSLQSAGTESPSPSASHSSTSLQSSSMPLQNVSNA